MPVLSVHAASRRQALWRPREASAWWLTFISDGLIMTRCLVVGRAMHTLLCRANKALDVIGNLRHQCQQID